MGNVLFLVISLSALFLTACSSPEGLEASATAPIFVPTSTVTIAPPTPSNPGQTVEYNQLQVTVDRFEFTHEYTNEYGIAQNPPRGSKYLWVYVVLQNSSDQVMKIPRTDNFGVLYHDTELKSSYGHRQDYLDYTSLETQIFPEQTAEAWLRFETPETAEFSDLVFAFNPESNRISLKPSSRGPWFEHPVYLWNLTP